MTGSHFILFFDITDLEMSQFTATVYIILWSSPSFSKELLTQDTHLSSHIRHTAESHACLLFALFHS